MFSVRDNKIFYVNYLTHARLHETYTFLTNEVNILKWL
nr:MAG TPA: hypothetical protein [Caudoviricetes sp.]DAU07902.1 MAG TPA: hypothetical protein [Caudoviricetes sp.]DAY74065.1 MAG TPA: hypothetical protein [Caudoviricetes sp.]